MEFIPVIDRASCTDVKLIKSDQHQVFGRFTGTAVLDDGTRLEIKELLRRMKQDSPNIEKSIFNAIHAVCLDTFPGYKSGGEEHSFLENYDLQRNT